MRRAEPGRVTQRCCQVLGASGGRGGGGSGRDCVDPHPTTNPRRVDCKHTLIKRLKEKSGECDFIKQSSSLQILSEAPSPARKYAVDTAPWG